MLPIALSLIAATLAAQQPRSAPRDQAAAQRRTAHKEPAPRSTAVRRAFQQAHPCPSNQKTTGACPGYVVDHITPLACGGKDEPANMQWQTIADAKEKDKWERNGCQQRD
jgi:hypothetical protein